LGLPHNLDLTAPRETPPRPGSRSLRRLYVGPQPPAQRRRCIQPSRASSSTAWCGSAASGGRAGQEEPHVKGGGEEEGCLSLPERHRRLLGLCCRRGEPPTRSLDPAAARGAAATGSAPMWSSHAPRRPPLPYLPSLLRSGAILALPPSGVNVRPPRRWEGRGPWQRAKQEGGRVAVGENRMKKGERISPHGEWEGSNRKTKMRLRSLLEGGTVAPAPTFCGCSTACGCCWR
jgi:hypothetical protein